MPPMFAPAFLFIFLSVASVALFSFIAVSSWSESRRREREAFYKSETIKKIADSSEAGAGAALEFLREQDRIAQIQRREGLRVGGLTTATVGVALIIFLGAVHPAGRVFTLGFIPFLAGLALLAYTYLLAPKL